MIHRGLYGLLYVLRKALDSRFGVTLRASGCIGFFCFSRCEKRSSEGVLQKLGRYMQLQRACCDPALREDSKEIYA